jgi:hypothetical protein
MIQASLTRASQVGSVFRQVLVLPTDFRLAHDFRVHVPWLTIVVYTAPLGTCTESFRWPFGVLF